jgi:hypothetical protein
MQCPDCGYEADDDAVFCPQCRFQFRGGVDAPAGAGRTIIDLPERGMIADEDIYEAPPKRLSKKELRLLEVQLLQPAVLVVLIAGIFVYAVISGVPFIPVAIGGLEFGTAGIISFACGLLSGIVFYFFLKRSLVKFQYR